MPLENPQIIASWTEDDLLDIPPSETDDYEFKSSLIKTSRIRPNTPFRYNAVVFQGQSTSIGFAIPKFCYTGHIGISESHEMTKSKNTEKPQKPYYQPLIIGFSLVIGIAIGMIFVPLFVSETPLPEVILGTPTPEVFGSPQVNYTFISPLSSATSYIQLGRETETPTSVEIETIFIDSVLMCTEIPRNTDGQYVFRIWLQQSMELFRLDENGNNFCRLTDNDVNDDQAKWSPDGERIAFVSSLDGYGIYIMNTDGTNIELVTTGGSAYSYPSWSPDGSTLIFQATIDEQFDIFQVDIDGSNLQNLTNQERLDSMPVWSPNGNFIVFASDRTFNPYSISNEQRQSRSYDIYMVNLDGLNARRLTVTSGSEVYPSWSPNSQQIAFVANYQIMLMNRNGSNIRPLTTGTFPIWLNDGQRIAYVRTHIYTINIDGTGIEQVSDFAIPQGSGIQYLDYTQGISQ